MTGRRVAALLILLACCGGCRNSCVYKEGDAVRVKMSGTIGQVLYCEGFLMKARYTVRLPDDRLSAVLFYDFELETP